MYSLTEEALKAFDNQHDFERMSADILNALGNKNVVPIAPHGGSDGGKDITFNAQNGESGLACVTLRKDIEKKFREDFSQRRAGEFDIYFLFCTKSLTSQQKQKFRQYCKDNLKAQFIPCDLEFLRSLLDTKSDIRERYLHTDVVRRLLLNNSSVIDNSIVIDKSSVPEWAIPFFQSKAHKLKHWDDTVFVSLDGTKSYIIEPNPQLKQARTARALTQRAVAEKIGVEALTVRKWERGDVLPENYYIQKLCDLFGKPPEELGFAFHMRLQRIRTARAWTQQELAEKIGVELFTLRRWEHGDVLPENYYIQKLCELFGIAPEELGIEEKTFPDDLEVIPTGFEDLDRLMGGGLQRSDLIIIGALPSTGKTSLALSIALNAAIKYTRTVGIFSLETSKERLVRRLLSMDASVDQHRLQAGWLEDDEWDRINYSWGTISEANIWIDETAHLTITQLRRQAQKLVIEYKVDLLIIDYIDLIQTNITEKQNGNSEQEIAEICRYLKITARELNIPILALATLKNRRVKIPELADISDSIEKYADVIMFLYRDDMHNPFSERMHIADLIVGKHRNGPIGEISLYFDSSTMCLRNLERLDS